MQPVGGITTISVRESSSTTKLQLQLSQHKQIKTITCNTVHRFIYINIYMYIYIYIQESVVMRKTWLQFRNFRPRERVSALHKAPTSGSLAGNVPDNLMSRRLSGTMSRRRGHGTQSGRTKTWRSFEGAYGLVRS